MSLNKVWIVICESGGYSDYDKEIEAVFDSKEKAEKMLEKYEYNEDGLEKWWDDNDNTYSIEEYEVE